MFAIVVNAVVVAVAVVSKVSSSICNQSADVVSSLLPLELLGYLFRHFVSFFWDTFVNVYKVQFFFLVFFVCFFLILYLILVFPIFSKFAKIQLKKELYTTCLNSFETSIKRYKKDALSSTPKKNEICIKRI